MLDICFTRVEVRKRRQMSGTGLPPYDYLSASQLEALVRYVKDEANEARRKGATRAVVNELIVALMVRTGLRAGELCNLNIADLPASHGEDTIWIRDVKTMVTRKVDIDSETTRSLNKFVKLYRQGAAAGTPLFVSERGGRLSYMSLYSKIKIIGTKAGIGSLYPQMLRHTYLVRLYDATQDLRLVQLQAGHAHSSSTARYAKESRKRLHTGFPPGGVAARGNEPSASPTRVGKGRNGTSSAGSSAKDNAVVTCEACNRPVSMTVVTKIDSGQSLCPDCLQEIRNK